MLSPPKPPLPPIPPLPLIAPLAPAPAQAIGLPNGCDQVLHLMGATKLVDFLTFALQRADLSVDLGGDGNTEMDLAEAWRDAAEGYRELAQAEAYPLELPGVFPLPDSMSSHVDAFLGKAHVQREFDQVPVALGMVPLAHLIAVQTRMNMTTVAVHAAQLAERAIADLALAQLCLPLEAPLHVLQVVERNDEAITFASEHHDIRFLHADVTDTLFGVSAGRGHLKKSLALGVGFPGNVLNVIRFENRFILNHGYHRAYALLKCGVTHVPAVIQMCRHWDDVALLGNTELFNNVAVYIERTRPPLLKDFADRLFHVAFAVPRVRRYVRVRYQVETGYLRD